MCAAAILGVRIKCNVSAHCLVVDIGLNQEACFVDTLELVRQFLKRIGSDFCNPLYAILITRQICDLPVEHLSPKLYQEMAHNEGTLQLDQLACSLRQILEVLHTNDAHY